MEWDTDRAGGFEPLRFAPRDKMIVLGLVSSKFGKLETKDEIKQLKSKYPSELGDVQPVNLTDLNDSDSVKISASI